MGLEWGYDGSKMDLRWVYDGFMMGYTVGTFLKGNITRFRKLQPRLSNVGVYYAKIFSGAKVFQKHKC